MKCIFVEYGLFDSSNIFLHIQLYVETLNLIV